jgi:hypothetical protein
VASIPLPALHVNPPAEQPNLLNQYAQVLGIKQQQQERALQIQATQQQNEQRQVAVQDQQKLRDLYVKHSGDLDKVIADAPTAGVSPQSVNALAVHNADLKTKMVQVDSATLANAQTQADLVQGAHDAVDKAPAAEKPAVYQAQLQALTAAKVDTSKFPPQYPGDETFKFLGATVKGHKQQIDEALKASEARKNDAEAAAAGGVGMKQMNDWLAKNPGKGPADYQTFTVNQSRESEILKETDPRVLRSKMNLAASEAQVQQAIKNGSAKDAGKLLAGGFVAPSEITARANPSFLVQAVNEARKLQPDFNPQKAEADFNVAKSPGNLGFFGSAKSLTDKGGTLDQLAAAAKDIPQHDIPVFNTIDDAVKAASGSGPVAKYASLLVGVSDDYSKVMGGGTGSDSSRAQAFQLAKMSASPDQRENAIAGIRGAVGSQINSRIGNNKVLKNMYGQQTDSDPFAAFGGVKH